MTKKALLPGQLGLGELGEFPDAPPVMKDLVASDASIAFGRVVMPYFFGLKPEDYENIPESHIEAANPRGFLPYLLPGRRKQLDSVVDGIALPAEEYVRVVRSPDSFVQAVGNTTLKARQLDYNLERRNDAVERSETHAVTNKYHAMRRSLTGVRTEQKAIELLRKESRHPGYAHVKSSELLVATDYVRTLTFGRILNVVGTQKSWTTEQAEQAERALDYRLFFTGKQRVDNWKEMLRVADLYGKQRGRLFQDRIKTTRLFLLKQGVAAEELT